MEFTTLLVTVEFIYYEIKADTDTKLDPPQDRIYHIALYKMPSKILT